jgi:hypothetical protein
VQDEPEQGILNPFLWDSCELDQMLVFSLDDLPVIFDVVISNMKPVRLRQYRVIPANVIFLSARYAHYFGSEEMMEELLLGAIERIEAAVHVSHLSASMSAATHDLRLQNRPSDMANCAFWLSNCLLLLYYLRTEPNLFISTEEYQVHLSDLINEIFVFVIRDAEQRIDRVLEQAMLEYEGLPGFEDVEFQDEWGSSRFVKKLTGRGKRPLPKSVSAMSIFESTNSTAAPSPPRSRQSSHFSTDATPLDAVSPRSITSILSSTLFILQIYDIPPAIVVQCFAQLMYWISCEVFNRLLTQVRPRSIPLPRSSTDELPLSRKSTSVVLKRSRSSSTHPCSKTGSASTPSPRKSPPSTSPPSTKSSNGCNASPPKAPSTVLSARPNPLALSTLYSSSLPPGRTDTKSTNRA